MKFIKVFLPLYLLTMFCQAQTTTAVTDEDLKKYAVTMDSIQGMQNTLQEIIAQMVRESTTITVTRYNELIKAKGDETKLAAANVTQEERAFLKDIDDKKNEELERINNTYQALAKEYVGLKTFNAVKKALENDPAIKQKYDAMVKELNEKSGE